eukprot:CAMPEP_0174923586 /NCGR_PEP_ID=MMETSP1355-20121228/6682_1 /TAXON_ID=464990 /ORGANISM="Hemiselmis tepida, Strain CCMP443" /LENGTH=209 /DNA_ID=CAMNT_0016169297 /DNA_START=203 /DNA_END=827 /DNA_ORIENTATION=+
MSAIAQCHGSLSWAAGPAGLIPVPVGAPAHEWVDALRDPSIYPPLVGLSLPHPLLPLCTPEDPPHAAGGRGAGPGGYTLHTLLLDAAAKINAYGPPGAVPRFWGQNAAADRQILALVPRAPSSTPPVPKPHAPPNPRGAARQHPHPCSPATNPVPQAQEWGARAPEPGFPTMSATRLVAAGGHALLVVLGGLIVGVDDGVGGDAVGVVG